MFSHGAESPLSLHASVCHIFALRVECSLTKLLLGTLLPVTWAGAAPGHKEVATPTSATSSPHIRHRPPTGHALCDTVGHRQQ